MKWRCRAQRRVGNVTEMAAHSNTKGAESVPLPGLPRGAVRSGPGAGQAGGAPRPRGEGGSGRVGRSPPAPGQPSVRTWQPLSSRPLLPLAAVGCMGLTVRLEC